MLNLDLSILDPNKPLDINILKRVFEKIENYNNSIPNLENFKFFEIVETGIVVAKELKHNLNFIPKDVIILSTNPSTISVTFIPENFNKTTIQYTTTGACTVRCLVGSFK